jgi:hypothetical protein
MKLCAGRVILGSGELGAAGLAGGDGTGRKRE